MAHVGAGPLAGGSDAAGAAEVRALWRHLLT
jgi:hypothetical protein